MEKQLSLLVEEQEQVKELQFYLQKAKEGADVIIIGRRKEVLEETSKLEPNKITYVVGDITKEESIKNLMEYVNKKFG